MLKCGPETERPPVPLLKKHGRSFVVLEEFRQGALTDRLEASPLGSPA